MTMEMSHLLGRLKSGPTSYHTLPHPNTGDFNAASWRKLNLDWELSTPEAPTAITGTSPDTFNFLQVYYVPSTFAPPDISADDDLQFD